MADFIDFEAILTLGVVVTHPRSPGPSSRAEPNANGEVTV